MKRDLVDDWILLFVYVAIAIIIIWYIVNNMSNTSFDGLYVIFILMFLIPEIGLLLDKLNSAYSGCTCSEG